MGGEDDDRNDLATVEVYSPKTNSWRSCTPMSQRRTGAVAGVVGGRLVVAGGFGDGGGLLSSVEAYTGTGWTPLPPMPHEAYMATACVLNGRLHVMGGILSNKLQVLEMTEENGLSWSRKADLPAIRWEMRRALSTRAKFGSWAEQWTSAARPRCSSMTPRPTRGSPLLRSHANSVPAARPRSRGAFRLVGRGRRARSAVWTVMAGGGAFAPSCGSVLLGEGARRSARAPLSPRTQSRRRKDATSGDVAEVASNRPQPRASC